MVLTSRSMAGQLELKPFVDYADGQIAGDKEEDARLRLVKDQEAGSARTEALVNGRIVSPSQSPTREPLLEAVRPRGVGRSFSASSSANTDEPIGLWTPPVRYLNAQSHTGSPLDVSGHVELPNDRGKCLKESLKSYVVIKRPPAPTARSSAESGARSFLSSSSRTSSDRGEAEGAERDGARKMEQPAKKKRK